MEAARKITDGQDLSDIHEHGDGFVLYPFGRKLHSARCDTVPGMALNPKEPRWFAPDVAAAREYQADRLARYPTAQPFERVQCCGSLIPDEAVFGACRDHPPSSPAQVAADSPSTSDSGEGCLWTGRAESASFELWTTRRTPFETDQSAQQKAMIRRIAPLVALLRCDSRERLHGVFVSDETASKQPDPENIASYNFGSAPFAGSGSVIAFERSYGAAPESPQALDGPARYYHRWSVVPMEAPLGHWIEGDVVARWTDVPVDLEGDLGLAAWRAMRENPERVTVEAALGASDCYGIDVTLSAPRGRTISIVKVVKGLVDGPLAGLQRTETLEPDIVLKLLARRWGHPIDEQTLLRLATANTPPTLLPRAPFNRNGLDPCDELCVAGIARTVTGDGPAVLSGRVFRVQAR